MIDTSKITLPIFVAPYEDELLISWMYREAAALGYDSYIAFYNEFVDPGRSFKSQSNYKGSSRMDGQIRLDNLQVLWGVPMIEMYLQHTEYAAVAPFLSPYRQASILLTAFNNPLGTKYARSSSNTKYEKQCLKFCPLCQKEHPYPRVSHNLPGITACVTHGCKTVSIPYNVKTKSIICSDDTVLPASEEEIRVAELAKRMLDNPIQCHYGNLNQLTFDLFKPNIKSGAFNVMASAVLERDIVEQFFALKEPDVVPDLGPDYEVLSHSPTYCVVRHECGMVFAMTEWGLRHGLLCPRCQKGESVRDRVQRILQAEGDYSLLSDMNSVNDMVSIRYPNGIIREHRANIFLNNLFPKPKGRVGYPTVQPEEQKRERRKNSVTASINEYEGFVCEELYDPTYKGGFVATIKHIPCGNSFKKSPRSFKTNPQCPFCSEKAPSSKRENSICEAFLAENAPEFTYLGGYHGSHSSVSLRHTCGFEFQERFSIFKSNPECPYCKRAESTGSGAFLEQIRSFYGNTFPRYSVAEDLHMAKTEVKSRLGTLRAAGLVRRIDNTTYEITPPSEINKSVSQRHHMPLYAKIINWAVQNHRETFGVSEVTAVFCIQSATACFYLRRLENMGFVTKIGKARYALTDPNQKVVTASEWNLITHPDTEYAIVYRHIKAALPVTFTRRDVQDSWPDCPYDLDHIQKALAALVKKSLLSKDSYHVYRVVGA